MRAFALFAVLLIPAPLLAQAAASGTYPQDRASAATKNCFDHPNDKSCAAPGVPKPLVPSNEIPDKHRIAPIPPAISIPVPATQKAGSSATAFDWSALPTVPPPQTGIVPAPIIPVIVPPPQQTDFSSAFANSFVAGEQGLARIHELQDELAREQAEDQVQTARHQAVMAAYADNARRMMDTLSDDLFEISNRENCIGMCAMGDVMHLSTLKSLNPETEKIIEQLRSSWNDMRGSFCGFYHGAKYRDLEFREQVCQ